MQWTSACAVSSVAIWTRASPDAAAVAVGRASIRASSSSIAHGISIAISVRMDRWQSREMLLRWWRGIMMRIRLAGQVVGLLLLLLLLVVLVLVLLMSMSWMGGVEAVAVFVVKCLWHARGRRRVGRGKVGGVGGSCWGMRGRRRVDKGSGHD